MASFAKSNSSNANAPTLSITTASQLTQVAYDAAEKDRIMPCMLNIEACQTQDDDRKVIDIVIVLDKSGSMQGANKLGLCLKTAEFLCTQLTKRDRFGLVSYDTHVTADLGLTYMDKKGKAKAIEAIRRIRAGSMTNLSGGALKGVEMISEGLKTSEADVKSVLLLTDGLMNQGITSPPQLLEVMRNVLKPIEGIHFFTFGFGADHDEQLLRDLSEITTSAYYFIKSHDAIPTAFGDCLGGLLSVVAQNVRIVFRAAGGASFSGKIMTKYPTKLCDRGGIELTVGDISSEETKTIVMKVLLPHLSEPVHGSDAPVMVADVMFVDLEKNKPVSITEQLCIARPARENMKPEDPNKQVFEELTRSMTALALDEAKKLADNGDMKSARTRLTSSKQAIVNLGMSNFGKEYRSQTVEQCEDDLDLNMDAFSSNYEYQARGKYLATNMAQAHGFQKSSVVSATRKFGGYRKGKKSAFASNFLSKVLPGKK